ncbi:protein of unknown function DUF477 [Alkaliphilus metalliredigens QYMF]|uniref:TPM domain-containing protein n=1 Tax=Alkaliphilus metalliredigens (strain QYMF) TaxID=293826 RepID=A6TS05_ALKMQ|nr:TPM domain-containing protein [Alkaliphilus metalliredigens]ABR48973.1 protein of unknown function DUF477 [Alkaliphilus metalliredigens QYMF]
MKNQKRTLMLMLFIIVLISSSLTSVYAFSIPQTPTVDIYVQDYASMISSDVKEDMLRMSQALQEKTSAELVIVTVPSIEGIPIEEYILNLFRQWGIGSTDQNNGVLLLVAQAEGEARIEVGYGLEGAINDGKAGAIMDQMISYFQNENYSQGISTAYSLLLQEIAVEYNIDINEIFVGAEAITPTVLEQPTSIVSLLKMIGSLLLMTLLGMLIFSKVLGKNLFVLALLFLGDLASGKYAGPTGGGPHQMGGNFVGRSRRGRYPRGPRGPFGGGSSSGGSSIGRGGFGGGSSGGGGASRKW